MNKNQENEFNRIVECLMNQGDIDVLTDLIPDKVKIELINGWHEQDE